MGILDKIKSRVKSNIEYRRELQSAVKNRIEDRKESAKKNIKMRIQQPEMYRNLQHEKRKVALDKEIEMRKREATLAELNARRDRALKTSRHANSRPSYSNNIPFNAQPGYNPAGINPGEFMGTPQNGARSKRKKKGGDPFDMFGFP